MTVLNKLELKRKSLLRRANSLYHQSKQVSIHNWRLSKMPGFRRLLAKISSGVEVSSSDLLPYISREDLKSRHEVNYMLAEAFNRAGNYEQAKVFIRRIWIFSRFDEKYLSLFIKIHVGCGDIASIREAHKTLGLRAADEKKIVEALNHFNAWQYAYAVHNGVDEYHYDFEVLDRIALLAKPHSFPTKEQQSTKGRKIRLAYLMFGMTHVNSVIVKNTLTFAKYHDAAVFDVTFYIPEQESLISQRKESVDNINRIKALGWNVIVAPDIIL